MAVPPWPSSLEENDKHCSSLLSAAARRLVATITSSWGGIVDMDFQVLYAACACCSQVALGCAILWCANGFRHCGQRRHEVFMNMKLRQINVTLSPLSAE